MSSIPSKDEIEAYLNQGLLNQWYAVAPSYLVTPKQPISIIRLGRKIVLWRNCEGQVQAIEDYCPHRGAPLSQGEIIGNNIACAYHGVVLDGRGIAIEVPAIKGCRWEGTKTTYAYCVIEKFGAIFIYFGDECQSSKLAVTFPEPLSQEDEYENILCVTQWCCNYRYALDNLVDPMHGIYLHANSHAMSSGKKSAEMKLLNTTSGFIIRKQDQENINFDWSEFGFTGISWVRLAIPYPAEAGPGGPFHIVAMTTPVDEEHCMVFFWRIRQVEGFNRALWKFMYRTNLEERHWSVILQDQAILEAMPSNARMSERLYSHDKGVTRLRGILKAMAKKHLTELNNSKKTS